MNECIDLEDYHLNADLSLSIDFFIGEGEIHTQKLAAEEWLEASRMAGLCEDLNNTDVIVHNEYHFQGESAIESREHTEEMSINTFYDRLTCGDIRRILKQIIINKSIEYHDTNRGRSASD